MTSYVYFVYCVKSRPRKKNWNAVSASNSVFQCELEE